MAPTTARAQPVESELVLITPVARTLTDPALAEFAKYAKAKWNITVRTSFASARSALAMVTPVGSPSATSLANEGPASTAMRAWGQRLANHLRHQRASPALDTLGAGNQGCAGSQASTQFFGDAAQKLRGDGKEYEIGRLDRICQMAGRCYAGLNGRICEEQGIASAGIDRCDDLGLACPQPRLKARTPHGAGHGGSERAAADYGCRLHGLLSPQ
jgi:hypothetical protein